MAMKPLPDQRLLRQLLAYDPAIGKLHWRRRPPQLFSGNQLAQSHAAAIWNSRFAGREAFTARHAQGYRHGRIGRSNFMAHRVIWKLVHGVDPQVIDHINGKKDNNRLANLRAVTNELNARNMPRQCNNTSGYTGVHLCRTTGRWRAELIVGGRHIRLGRFNCKEDAAKARRQAAAKHGFHANHGR